MEDASTLRWILIIAGAALLGGLLLFGNPNRKPKTRKPKKRKSNRRKAAASSGGATRREPTLDPNAASEDASAEPSRFDDPSFGNAPPEDFSAGEPSLGASDTGQGELPIGTGGETPAAGQDGRAEPTLDAPRQDTTPNPAAPPMDPPEKVIVLYLQARDNRKVVGVELLDAAMKSGMEFGEMQVFHRMVEGSSQPVFSMANLENPGTFDKDSWPTLETKGMTLFLGLPGPMPALGAWDAMVATSRRLGELLHLDVLDQNREHFTRQREGEIREELREFERSQQPEG